MSLTFEDYNSVTLYGADLQQMIAELTHRMLKNMKETETKDVMDEIQQTVSMLSSVEQKQEKKLFWFGKSKKDGFYQKEQKKQELLRRVEQMEQKLEQRRLKLLMDSSLYEKMYQMSLGYQQQLEDMILQAKDTIAEWETQGVKVNQGDVLLKNNMLTQLEQRVEELSLSKVVVGQQSAQIRILQENASSVARNLQSTLYNVIPLWRNQMTIKEDEKRKLSQAGVQMQEDDYEAYEERQVRQKLIDSLGELLEIYHAVEEEKLALHKNGESDVI